MRGFARAVTAAALFAALLCGSAFAVSVEQVQVCLPEIDVYLYEGDSGISGVAAEEISAALDGRPLSVRSFGRSEQGIFYVYMLDVSASVPAGHFSAARAAVLEAWERLRPQDRLALITFGSEVTLRLSGGESQTMVAETLDSLLNKDTSTQFYNAMDTLIDVMLQTEDMRRVAVVISDGIDDTDAGMTQQELEDELIRTGVSVSALCVDTAAPAAAENFAGFIRLSGGELYTFGASDAGTVLDALLDRLEDGWLLRLETPTNIVSGREELLTVDFGGVSALEIPVVSERWTPDEKPPRVESVAYSAEGPAFTVTFSEAVAGLDNPDAFVLTDGNGASSVIASIDIIDRNCCRLNLEAPPPENSSLTLTVSGLTDVSMEENEMYRFSQVVWSGETPPSPGPETGSAEEEPLIETGTLILLGAIFALAAAALAVIVRLASKKAGGKKEKKEKKAKDRPDPVRSTATFMFLDGEKEDGKP